MQIPKDMILEVLKKQGSGVRADQAERELPEQVDPERDSGLLQKYGLDPQEVSKLGADIPGL